MPGLASWGLTNPSFPSSPASWGILPFRSHLAGYLLRVHGECRTVPPFRVSTLRDVRSVLYAGFRIECRLAFAWQTRPGTVPFWACPIASVGRFSLTTPHRTFTCVDPSCLLNGVAASGSRFTAFSSSLPTFDDQSPAVERCSHPSTWGGWN